MAKKDFPWGNYHIPINTSENLAISQAIIIKNQGGILFGSQHFIPNLCRNSNIFLFSLADAKAWISEALQTFTFRAF